MAKLLKELPPKKNPAGIPLEERYPDLPTWADGDAWQVKAGVDFHIRPTSFRALLVKYAKDNGKTVQTRLVDENTLAFKFSKGS